MPRSSRSIRRLGDYDNNDPRLVDEVEGDYDLVSTPFVLHLAPNTDVLARAADDGIDDPRCGLKELGVGARALCADLTARQGECISTLGHVGLLVGLVGGVGRDAEEVKAPDPLLRVLFVEWGVDDAHIALGGASRAEVDDFLLAGLGQDGEGITMHFGGGLRRGGNGSEDAHYAKRHHCQRQRSQEEDRDPSTQ
jgi:hypothetical protein